MNNDCNDNDWAYTVDCSRVNDIQIFKDGPKKLNDPTSTQQLRPQRLVAGFIPTGPPPPTPPFNRKPK